MALVMAAGCDESAPLAEQTEAPRGPTEMPLDNEQYSILEMATAHGAFTLEVEVDAGADTLTIARQLIEPIKEQYAEVLVYLYDRSGDGELPMRRVQWTDGTGYTDVEY
jgi:hypothetical protein